MRQRSRAGKGSIWLTRFCSGCCQRWFSARAAVAFFLVLGCLPHRARADTYDIHVNLFTDINCLFPADNHLAADNTCYANKYSPNVTLAYKMRIVNFDSPARIDFREFSDDCHTLTKPKRTMIAGTSRCNLFLGSLYAQFDLRFRSNTCQGSKCSNLAITIQTFYSAASCTGPAYAVFRYPVQGECLRAKNGTQDIMTSVDDRNITLNDYIGSDDCAEPIYRRRTYAIVNQYCYPLYVTKAPRSFIWRVERNIPYKPTASGATRASALLYPLALAAGLSQASGIGEIATTTGMGTTGI